MPLRSRGVGIELPPPPNGKPWPPNGFWLSPPLSVVAALSGWEPSVTCTVFVAPPLCTVSATCEPGA